MQNEIVIYQSEVPNIRLEVRLGDETIWLSQQQIVDLFFSSKANISEHIKNLFDSEELEKKATVRKFRTVRLEGNRKVSRMITHYNLDVVISVGYRVNSKRGTQFRIWANQILKSYLLKGYAVQERINRVEKNVYDLADRVGLVEMKINSSLPPKQGVFFDGQVFDAYTFVSELIRSAQTMIHLIDNYVDETVLMLLTKRKKNVDANIYTQRISKQLKLDIAKHNLQYPKIELTVFTEVHDRFLILDNTVCYHFGASFKDLGKKWFAFCKIEGMAEIMIHKLQHAKVNQ